MYKLLIVDDDESLHMLFKKILGKKVKVTCVFDGLSGIEKLKRNGPYHLIMSDYEMPVMNGIEFFKQAKEISPVSVRILLSGKADLQVAVNAVNEGNVFRILTKPCPTKMLKIALRDALEHYRLSTLEDEMMNKTVKGVIHLVSDVATLLKPERNARTSRILPLVKSLSKMLADPDPWSTEVAAILSMIGFIFLPEPLMEKVEDGEVLGTAEYTTYLQHTQYSSKLISRVPRFENVVTKLSLQEAHFMQDSRDGGFSGDEIPLGARILKVVSDYDRLKSNGRSVGEVISMMKRREKRYDPKVITALVSVLGSDATFHIREVYPLGLTEGMILAEDVYGTVKGKRMKFLSKHQELDSKMIDYIHRNAEKIIDITKKITIKEKIFV